MRPPVAHLYKPLPTLYSSLNIPTRTLSASAFAQPKGSA